MKRVELSLKDLTTRFKKHTVTTTLQCTGNRRDMFNDVKKVKGLEWGVGECNLSSKLQESSWKIVHLSGLNITQGRASPELSLISIAACPGAIGTAEFAGARLSDILTYAGLDADNLGEVEHIQFEGLDSDVSGTCYGASIPASKAVNRADEVIVAYEMNGG